MKPTYRTGESYAVNYEAGPDLDGWMPPVPPTPAKELVGFEVNSRLGIAAGILLNAKWVAAYAKLGFDILTYKTVRSEARECYPPPNWVRLELAGSPSDDPDVPVHTVEPTMIADQRASWSVCFGMPSTAPEVWRADVAQAKRSLSVGQLLNVSVVGTPGERGTLDELADDFVRCARWAVESGADLIEANLACPNVTSAEGQLYQNPAAAERIAERIHRALPRTPLLLKAGYFHSPATLADFLGAVAPHARAVLLVSGLTRRVHRPNGQPAFPGHESAAIVGHAVHQIGVATVKAATAIIRRESLPIAIFGIGGITSIADANDYFLAGAQAVLLGSFPAVNPHFAVECKRKHPEW